jgi:hypothetical protein
MSESATETATPTEEATPTPTEEATPTPTEETTPTPGPTGAVRVAHLSPNAPNVDVYVDGTAVLEDVPFGAVSGYLDVPAGERQIEITPAGNADTSVFSGGVPIEAETVYTVAATGETGESADQAFEPLVLEDNVSDPGEDTARVRLLHASPDAPAVDVTLASSGEAVFDAVSYGDTGTIEVPAGDYTLEVRGDTESNDGDVVAAYDVSLSGNTVYTAYAAGYLSPGDDPADTSFDLLVSNDSAGGVASADTAPAQVRVIHLSPNAPNVDVYVDETAVLEDIPFGTTSRYLAVPAGDRQIEITPAGSPDTSVFSGSISVGSGSDYTIAATGEVGEGADEEFSPLVLDDNNNAPADDTARVRLLHASPDAPTVDVTVQSSGNTLFDGVPYGESGTVEVPAGDYTLEVRGDTESNDGTVVESFDVSFAGGQVYSVFAAGYLSPDDDPADTPFDLLVSQDTSSMGGSSMTGSVGL